MKITDVKADIKNRTIKPYYIFAGEEIEIQRIYVNKIAEVLGGKVVRVDSIADVWASIISPMLFGEPCVYVVRDDKDLQEDILSAQIEKNNLNGNIIINLLTTVDKRTKFYKANSDKIVLFERLNDEVLKKYIKKEITLNNTNYERLIAICENDFSRILLEIDKIKQYLMGVETKVEGQSRYDTAFEELVEDGTIAVPPQDAIFDLVDAILKRQRKRVYALLEQCYAVGEANMVILSVLYNNAKQVLQVQACEGKDVCSITGLTSWQVKCAREKCGHYSIDELFNILKLIQRVQKGIITGQIEDEISVDYLLVNIL